MESISWTNYSIIEHTKIDFNCEHQTNHLLKYMAAIPGDYHWYHSTYSLIREKEDEMLGAELLTKTLETAGMDHMFGVAGSSALGTLDSIAQSDIEYTGARHEQVAATMATGYAMASRRPTGSISHVGPGAANQIIGIAAAYNANAPVVSITGNEPSYRLGNDVRHEWDVLDIFSRFTKHNIRLTPDNPQKQIRDALFRTVLGMPGPVHIDVPRDFEETDVASPNKKSFVQMDDIEFQTPLVSSLPDDESVERTIELLGSADRPLLLLGNEVRWFDSAIVQDFAEKIELPVATSHNARGALSESHELSLGVVGRTGLEPTNNYLKQADLVLAIGSQLSDITTDNWELISDETTIVHATIQSRELNRHYISDISTLADPTSFLKAVLEAILNKRISISHADVAAEQRAKFEHAWNQILDSKSNPTEDGVDPRKLIKAVDRIAGDYAYTTGGGNHSTFGKALPVQEINETFTTSSFAGMSQGFPLAMGAQLALDKQMITIEGDGGFAMVMQDLETAVREEIPVKIIILNNNGLLSQAARQKKYYGGRFTGTMHSNPNFGEVAQKFGMFGEQITTDDQIEEAVERLFETDGPGLIDAQIDTWLGTDSYDRD